MSQPIHILILEDDETLREMLSEELEDRGYVVETAERGEQAVALAREKRFHLVVADIRMEGMDGLTALEGVKAHQPEVGSMVITGYTSEAESIRAVQLQVGEYLKKPFRLPVFIEAVERLVAQRLEAQRRREQADNFRQTVLWSLENLATPEVKVAGQLAARLAKQRGLATDFGQDLQLATLIHGLGDMPLPDFLRTGLSPAIEQLRVRASERWDGSGPQGLTGDAIPLGSRIIALSLAGSLESPLPEGHFDPELVELLQNEEDAIEPPPETERGLLALARVLEETGDRNAAEKTYEEVHQRYGATAESAISCLALARLRAERGDFDGCLQWADRAVQMGEALGPVTWSQVTVEAGLILARHRNPKGVELLEKVKPQLSELQSEQELARVSLALAHFAGSQDAALGGAAKVLARPENTGSLGTDAPWMLELLLGAPSLAEPGVILLKRIVRECPSAFQSLLLHSDTPAGVIVRGLPLLASVPEADSVLKQLEAHADAQVRTAATAGRSKESKAPALPLLRLYTLGGFRVYLGEERLDGSWKRQKAKYLLSFLASRIGSQTSEDAILEALWPDAPEAGRNSLYTTSSYLRRQMAPGKHKECNYVLRNPSGIAVNLELPFWHDLSQLEQEFQQADAAQKAERPDRAIKHLVEAARLYQGPYLENCFLDWAVRLRDQTETKMTRAFLHLAKWFLGCEKPAEAHEYARRALEIDPLSMDANLLVMNTLTALGRPEDAVRQFESCKKKLKKELDMEPSIALFEAFQRARLSIA